MYSKLSLNERLKNTRIYMGLSLETVSDLVDIPLENLLDFENGISLPNEDQLNKISNLYKHSLDFILNGYSQEEQEVKLLARTVDDLSTLDRDHIMRFSNVLSQMT